ncbi:MAG: NADH-ubiquinone oxidoreductase-F iron-sulfur binding region domain-containing protein [Caldisericales bacterium]|nr:NADH-quinone oxidoreductase subunit NuoF [bacterium]
MQTATDFALTKENLGAYLTGSLSGDSAKVIEAILSKLKREDVSKPTIYVGTGTCGLGAGAGKTLEAIKAYLAEKNIDADIVQIGCIGLCAEEPMVDFQLPGRTRISFRKITEDKVPQLMDAMLAGNVPEDLACFQFRSKTLKGWNNVKYMDEHPFFASQTRWVLAGCGIVDPTNIWEYIASDGYKAFAKAVYDKTRQEVCDMVEKSGLRGRGGGGFNTGTKWKLALQQEADQKYMICNADEGDPGAFMDRAVIEGDPHRMIEGLAIAAYAIGASKAYVYLRAEYPLAIKHLQQALKQAKEIGLLGENILDSGFDLEIKIKMGAGAFVCGEETALIHSIEGKRGMPRPRPPYPSVKGLFGKPTAINNVETLANVPALVRNGEGWFSSIGTATSKGTKVFALSGNVSNTGLVEVAMGTSLRKIIFEIGGGIPKGRQFKSVQIGGPSGGCMPTPLLDTEIDYESLKSAGAMMGSGGMVVMDDATCMVDVAKYFMDFIQRESCGKCIPCREGTRRMLEILTMITKGRKGEHGADALERFQGITQLERLAEVIKDTSLCGLGNTSPNPILSTLRWFKPEYEAHIYERRCPAGVCPELLVYSIDADKCTGCTLCAKNCPAASIMGAPKSPHYIITDKCISCGTCFTVCRFGAVSKS